MEKALITDSWGRNCVNADALYRAMKRLEKLEKLEAEREELRTVLKGVQDFMVEFPAVNCFYLKPSIDRALGILTLDK